MYGALYATLSVQINTLRLAPVVTCRYNDGMKKGREQVEEGAVVQIRIAATQKKLLMAAARRMGLSLSAWARLVMLKAEREQRAGGK
jgi:hypothetical protein